jgi:phosphatidylglycerophosphate synthase
MKLKDIYAEHPGEDFIRKRDCLVALYWHNLISIPIVRLMQKLKLKVHPNVITIITILFGLLAGYFFLMNELVYGAIFFTLNMVSDTIDGKWARLTGKMSKFGKKLDITGDRICKISWYFGIWYSQYYQVKGFWWIGIVLIVAHYMLELFREKFIGWDFYKYVRHLYYSPFEDAYVTFLLAPLLTVTIHIPHYYVFSVAVMLLCIAYIRCYFVVKKEENDDSIKKPVV